MQTRRGFLKMLGLGAAVVTVAPKLMRAAAAKAEPVKRKVAGGWLEEDWYFSRGNVSPNYSIIVGPDQKRELMRQMRGFVPTLDSHPIRYPAK